MMIGILGTGVVGTTLGTALVEHENEVMLGARGMEAYLPFWVAALSALGTPHFNVRIVR